MKHWQNEYKIKRAPGDNTDRMPHNIVTYFQLVFFILPCRFVVMLQLWIKTNRITKEKRVLKEKKSLASLIRDVLFCIYSTLFKITQTKFIRKIVRYIYTYVRARFFFSSSFKTIDQLNHSDLATHKSP